MSNMLLIAAEVTFGVNSKVSLKWLQQHNRLTKWLQLQLYYNCHIKRIAFGPAYVSWLIDTYLPNSIPGFQKCLCSMYAELIPLMKAYPQLTALCQFFQSMHESVDCICSCLLVTSKCLLLIIFVGFINDSSNFGIVEL